MRSLLKTGVVALALAATTTGGVAHGATPPTRYSLANGCYAIQGADGTALPGASAVRMQATTLGKYLLYTAERKFLTAQAGGTITAADAPSDAGDWEVKEAPGGAFTMTPGGGTARTVRFVAAGGCAVYPEAELDATGTPFKGATPDGAVKGWMDGHLHWENWQLLGGGFKCGKPFDPYGIPFALPDCSSVEGPMGTAAPIQNFLVYGNPVSPHDTTGWPKLSEWSRQSIGNSHEGSYWRWMQRVWMSGMRLMVMPVNDNRELCSIYPQHTHPCGEMATVTRAIDDMRAMQKYVDAQMGGPGKGFFEIVTNPFDARRVINEGKLAVVLEIEISELFDCRGFDDQNSSCTREDVDRGLQSVYDRGVRSMLLLNKVDNPFAGVRFDSGPIGALINAANQQSSGSFWSATTCQGKLHDNTIDYGTGQGIAGLQPILSSLGVQGGTLPTYPPAPDCNTRGLTDLGAYLVRRMIEMGMIVNPDHMSQKAVDQTLSLAEAARYAGVISPHGWMDPGNWPRIWKLGGLVRYSGGDVPEYVKGYKDNRPISSPYLLGSPLGTDIAGLFAQPGPSPDAAKVMQYPFTSLDGKVTFTKQRTGERTFDYRTEGIAHYGEYADWLQDLKLHSNAKLVHDVMDGAEAYLDMWERAEGVPGPHCEARDIMFRAGGLRHVRLGAGADAVLRRAGQPQVRTGSWSWCVRGDGRSGPAITAVLSPAGKVALVASTAPHHDILEIEPGAPVAELRKHATPAGGGVWLRRAGSATFVFVVRSGRVQFDAVTTKAIAANRKLLRRYLRGVRLRVARPLPFVPAKQAKTRVAGATVPPALAGLTHEQVASLGLLCALL